MLDVLDACFMPWPSTASSGCEPFMHREIHAQPQVLQACLSQYFPHLTTPGDSSTPIAALQGLDLAAIEQVQILACGTSFHAALVAQHWLEQLAGIPTWVRSAAAYPTAPIPLTQGTLVIAVTQSGETADTLAAVQAAQALAQSATVPVQWLGITNQDQSSLASLTPNLLLTPAGNEVAIAATKTFSAQLMALLCVALTLSDYRQTLPASERTALLQELAQLPQKASQLLGQTETAIASLAQTLVAQSSVIILGWGIQTAIAQEAALKLKETTYTHAEGYAGGEFMHGPVALVDHHHPVIAIALPGSIRELALTHLQTVKQRGSPLIGLGVTQDAELAAIADTLLEIPTTHEALTPFLSVIPLQLLAYWLAIHRGLEVDHPRGLQKALIHQP